MFILKTVFYVKKIYFLIIKRHNVTKGIAKNHLHQDKQSCFTYFRKTIIHNEEWVLLIWKRCKTMIKSFEIIIVF